jgi:hypothetical protein
VRACIVRLLGLFTLGADGNAWLIKPVMGSSFSAS